MKTTIFTFSQSNKEYTEREREREKHSKEEKMIWRIPFTSAEGGQHENFKIKRNIYSYINVSQCKYQLKIKLERWARISSLAFFMLFVVKVSKENFPSIIYAFLVGNDGYIVVVWLSRGKCCRCKLLRHAKLLSSAINP